MSWSFFCCLVVAFWRVVYLTMQPIESILLYVSITYHIIRRRVLFCVFNVYKCCNGMCANQRDKKKKISSKEEKIAKRTDIVPRGEVFILFQTKSKCATAAAVDRTYT